MSLLLSVPALNLYSTRSDSPSLTWPRHSRLHLRWRLASRPRTWSADRSVWSRRHQMTPSMTPSTIEPLCPVTWQQWSWWWLWLRWRRRTRRKREPPPHPLHRHRRPPQRRAARRSPSVHHCSCSSPPLRQSRRHRRRRWTQVPLERLVIRRARVVVPRCESRWAGSPESSPQLSTKSVVRSVGTSTLSQTTTIDLHFVFFCFITNFIITLCAIQRHGITETEELRVPRFVWPGDRITVIIILHTKLYIWRE